MGFSTNSTTEGHHPAPCSIVPCIYRIPTIKIWAGLRQYELDPKACARNGHTLDLGSKAMSRYTLYTLLQSVPSMFHPFHPAIGLGEKLRVTQKDFAMSRNQTANKFNTFIYVKVSEKRNNTLQLVSMIFR